MKRPSVEASLKPLKSFQRRTVEHAFDRLFMAEDSTGRFLVADEVGLGKTLVARGIIARAIDHLWNDVERIDIVYICSNGSIARANLPKLQVGGAAQSPSTLPAYSRHLREPSARFTIPGVRSRFSMLTSLMCSSIRLIRCLEEMLDGCYIRHFGSSCSLALRTAFDQDVSRGCCAVQRVLVA